MHPGTIHADQLILHLRRRCDRPIDSLSLSAEVGVKSAENHAAVVFDAVSMELQKVAAIVRQQNPIFGSRECQDLGVRNRRIRLSGVQRSENIMPEPSQFQHDLQAMFSFE